MNNNVQQLIQAVSRADSSNGLLEAVKALAATRQEAATPTLIEVLGYNNPGASVAAVDGLIEIGKSVVPDLLDKIDGYNYGARAWATRVLAGIGDPRGLELLLDAAVNDFSLSVRRAAARGLGNLRWGEFEPERLLYVQASIFSALQKVAEDPEWVVRYAAIVGLEGLAFASQEFKKQISETLQHFQSDDLELAIRTRAHLALSRL